jgi:hypothetical protein
MTRRPVHRCWRDDEAEAGAARRRPGPQAAPRCRPRHRPGDLVDDPAIRERLIKAIDAYTAIYRKGCTPPDSVAWIDVDNNKRFHAQSVGVTPNETLSAVNAFKRERPDDYYENTATIEWPLGRRASPFRSEARRSLLQFSRAAAMRPSRKHLSAFSSLRAGSRTISTFRASASCRQCRSSSISRSGLIRATHTAWPQ